MPRIIFHVDVNNAFLSWTAVDLLRKGSKVDIREIPSVIGGDERLRHGVVLAKSPVAKKYGIVTGESLYAARKKCPNLEVFLGDYKLYQEESNKLFNYLSQYTPDIERFSIDECYLDMSNTSYLYVDLIELAYKIKDEIKRKFGFTVNVGIGNNKLCAKMASDLIKPDKVNTIFSDEIESKMWVLPVSDLYMVGKKSSEQLRKLGINTIGDLAKTDVKYLKKYFNSFATTMHEFANGIDNSKVESACSKNKCISISTTLPKDVSDKVTLRKILLKECHEVSLRLRKQGMYTKVIAITLRNSNFENYSHQEKLVNPTNITMDIYKVVLKLLDNSWKGEPIRNIGVRLSDFTERQSIQLSLFEEIKDSKKDEKIQKLLDQINEKYDNLKIGPAIMIDKDEK